MSKFEDIKFGLDTFGEVLLDDQGQHVSYGRTVPATVREVVLPDDEGVDVVALGDHDHREYTISLPETALAGIARVPRTFGSLPE